MLYKLKAGYSCVTAIRIRRGALLQLLLPGTAVKTWGCCMGGGDAAGSGWRWWWAGWGWARGGSPAQQQLRPGRLGAGVIPLLK
eukprot:SAG22_NODE_9995_length_559_cov_1.215217_1_plen_83_part_01